MHVMHDVVQYNVFSWYILSNCCTVSRFVLISQPPMQRDHLSVPGTLEQQIKKLTVTVIDCMLPVTVFNLTCTYANNFCGAKHVDRAFLYFLKF